MKMIHVGHYASQYNYKVISYVWVIISLYLPKGKIWERRKSMPRPGLHSQALAGFSFSFAGKLGLRF